MPNSIKKFSAVLTLLFGCCDKSSLALGPLVTKVKVGVLKNVAITKNAPENLLTFVTALAEMFLRLENNGFAIVVLSDNELI